MNIQRSTKVTVMLLFLSLMLMTPLAFCDSITPSPYWKNQIVFPDDPFRVPGSSPVDPSWVKFTILPGPYDPNIVYFQDSVEYNLHYTFASAHLDPFIGMTQQQFDQVTLYEQGQQAILGAVIMSAHDPSAYPPTSVIPEYGIQFVRRDAYTPQQIVDMFNIVKGAVIADPNVVPWYFPTFEQQAVAEANQDWLESQGVFVSSPARWIEGNICYSQGWALGELKYFPGDQIESAYHSGALKPDDILLTDGVPAEIPFVAGVVTLSPSTPNSHVAILASTYNVPFAYLSNFSDVDKAQQLLGHKIVLRAYSDYLGTDVRLIDTEEILTENQIDEILQLKTLPVLDIVPMAEYGAYSASTDSLVPEDIQYFGGKAANFGILRSAVTDKSPVAMAFSFDLWNEFLDQTIYTGNTLRQEIASRLSGYIYPPSNMTALSVELDNIRDDLFRDDDITNFTQAQKDAIINALQDPVYGFDINEKIRFRSSTNVEDSENFIGAGLYDSYSGCFADDLDGDTTGPSICDSSDSSERGVFRAIRRVFASFYNENAYLERLRHNVNEDEVGMAVLVHHSFPDEYELANGVATLERVYENYYRINLVTQYGATSVTNPQDGSIPEEVYASFYLTSIDYLKLISSSNLIPLGQKVMQWQDDYIDLSLLLADAAKEFENVTGKTEYTLDFEYKKLAPGGAAMPDGGLVVKQIRQIPQPDTTSNITPFLINEPVEYYIFPGEASNIFSNHRLKSRWFFETRNFWLTEESIAESLYADVTIEYTDRGRIRRISQSLPFLPFAAHTYGGSSDKQATNDDWVMHHLANPRSYTLETIEIPIQVSPSESPIMTLTDLGNSWDFWKGLDLHVRYEEPVPILHWSGLEYTNDESVSLWPVREPWLGDQLQHRFFSDEGISISTSFYWPSPPVGTIGGYTAPLIRWVETVIEGYTSQAIVLHGYYSQTYKPTHHNFSEHFVFEPRLEPGISQDTLNELKAQDIRMIHLFLCDEPSPEITTYGFDDEPFLEGDFEPDGDVDIDDLGTFVIQWMDKNCDACGDADLNGDGEVTIDDLNEIALNWLLGT